MSTDPEPNLAKDPNFAPTERLFRRVPIGDVVDGSVSDASLPSPTFCVNREKYCSAAEALSTWKGFAVAALPVEGIPPVVVSDDGKEYYFGVEHVPEPFNYSHSEVNTYVRGEKMDTPQQPPRHVRKKFRNILRQRIEILEAEA